MEPNARTRARLTLLSGAGLRLPEVTDLRWRDLAECNGAGQVYGLGTDVHAPEQGGGRPTIRGGFGGRPGS